MKFRDMFKVRQPGHGDSFMKESNKEAADGISIQDKGKSVPNGGNKTSVKGGK